MGDIDLQVQKVLEEADVLKNKGMALYTAIVAGERGIEDMPQADAWIKEAGEKADLATGIRKGVELNSFLNDGQGSLTAGGAVQVPAPGQAIFAGETPKGPSDSHWKNFGHFALTVLGASGSKWERKLISKGVISEGDIDHLFSRQNEVKTLMQEGLGAAGGFLVETAYLAELFYKQWEASIVRSRARVLPMGVPSLSLPTLDQTITPADQKSAYFGGVYYEWTEEGGTKPELELLFKLCTLTVHELSGYLPVTNTLIEDSAISIDGLLGLILPASMKDAEDWWFLNGNGAGQPQGVISAPCTIQVARTAANLIGWPDVKSMVHAFEPNTRGVWVIHICAMEQIMGLVDTLGNAIWIPNAREGIPQTLFGYPILWTEKVPALGTKGDIGLYDFGYYLIGDRRGPTLDASTEYLFRSNETAYRISERVDGQPWLSQPLDLRPAGASSISPFVVLDTYQAE